MSIGAGEGKLEHVATINVDVQCQGLMDECLLSTRLNLPVY